MTGYINGCINNILKTQRLCLESCYLLLLVGIWIGIFFTPEMFSPLISGTIVCAFLSLFVFCSQKELLLTSNPKACIVSANDNQHNVSDYREYGTKTKKIESIHFLLPDALLSMTLYITLLIPVLFADSDYTDIKNILLTAMCGNIYSIASVEVISRICDRSDTLKHNLILFFVMLLSIPIIMLLLVSGSLNNKTQQNFGGSLREYHLIYRAVLLIFLKVLFFIQKRACIINDFIIKQLHQ